MAHALRIGRESGRSLLALDLRPMFSTRALAVLLVPLVELFVLIQVVQAFGGAVAIFALFGLSVFGFFLLRAQGDMALRSVAEALAGGASPASQELADRAIRFVAALLITVPGFVTAVAGAILFVPPVRALVRPLIQKRAESLIRPIPRSRRSVVDVDVVEVDDINGDDSASKPPTQTPPRLR